MDDRDGSENPFLRLYMKQLSLNWDVLSSILSHLSMVAKAIRERAQGHLRPDLEEAELSIAPAPRASINEVDMARTPYVTVRGDVPAVPPPQPKETIMVERRSLGAAAEPEEEEKPEKEKVEPVKFDVEEVVGLLDVIHGTKDLPNLSPINQAAMVNLAVIAAEIDEELKERAEEQRKKDEEESAKKEKKRQERLKEVEDEKILKEKEEREKAEKAAKEREAARQKEPEHA
jgi:hypothetical protein